MARLFSHGLQPLCLCLVFVSSISCLAQSCTSHARGPLLWQADEGHIVLPSSVDNHWFPPTHDHIPLPIREYWMQQAVVATVSTHGPCPSNPFGAVIVDHSTSIGGVHICNGSNDIVIDPTLHGEISAIRNCAAQFPGDLSSFFTNLTLYTTAEPCPMCMSALRWAGVREVIFATSTPRLMQLGWRMINIRAREVNKRSERLETPSPFLRGGILTHVTDPFFAWQYDERGECPAGCVKGLTKSKGCQEM